MVKKLHLYIELEHNTGKTKIWKIYSRHDNTCLGQVRWHPGWRTYVFWPNPLTIFSFDCLQELSVFMEDEVTKRKVTE
jgi:hypothetical protein